jgi:DNA-binding transcriptional regulator YiaG
MEKYKSEALGFIHKEARGLYKDGVIDEAEMREYDRECLHASTTPAGAAPKPAPALAISRK